MPSANGLQNYVKSLKKLTAEADQVVIGQALQVKARPN
jgi:hypothetical protein